MSKKSISKKHCRACFAQSIGKGQCPKHAIVTRSCAHTQERNPRDSAVPGGDNSRNGQDIVIDDLNINVGTRAPQTACPIPVCPPSGCFELQQENDELRRQILVLQRQNENLASHQQATVQSQIGLENLRAQQEYQIQLQQQKELEILAQLERQAQAQRAQPRQILDYHLAPTPDLINGRMSLTEIVNETRVCSAGVPAGTPASVNAEQGYWTLDTTGTVKAYGNAKCYGSVPTPPNRPAAGMAVTPDRKGYWIVTEDGTVYTFGNAQFYGSASTYRLSRPIVGIQATATGNGYWLVSSNGGVLAFGDAQFYGSSSPTFTSSQHPIIGIWR